MAYSSTRRRDNRVDQWPGFVDALATLLLVFIFLTSLFMIAQFFLSREVSSRDTVLTRLNAQISELTELLALERSSRSDVEDTLAALQASEFCEQPLAPRTAQLRSRLRQQFAPFHDDRALGDDIRAMARVLECPLADFAEDMT